MQDRPAAQRRPVSYAIACALAWALAVLVLVLSLSLVSTGLGPTIACWPGTPTCPDVRGKYLATGLPGIAMACLAFVGAAGLTTRRRWGPHVSGLAACSGIFWGMSLILVPTRVGMAQIGLGIVVLGLASLALAMMPRVRAQMGARASPNEPAP